jgi:hemerythrin-like domain-containing protein
MASCTTHEREGNIFKRLLVEHDHILKTLNFLENQFVDLCRDVAPEYTLMRSVIVYIQEYPEQAHHPLEDVIFSILLERKNEIELVQELITDHTELEVITRGLRDTLESIKSGIVSREELKKQLSTFLARQRQHLYIEEMRVYPLFQRVLTNKDWEHIKSIVPLLDDPVFGERTRSEYEILYREIEDKSK